MKRFVLVLVALGAVGLFSACKKDKKDKPADEAAKPTDTAATDTTKPADQPATDPAVATPAAGTDPSGATATPAAAGDTSTGIAECDAFIKRQNDCAKYPQAAKDAIKANVEGWKKAKAEGGEAEKTAAEGCKKAADQADAQLKNLGC